MKTRKDGKMNLPPSLVECTNCGSEIKGYLNRHKCKAQHTPTPWHYQNGFIGAPSNHPLANQIIARISDYANCDEDAAFIVRAVNAHATLLEAVRHADTLQREHDRRAGYNHGFDCIFCLALTKVEGK